MSSLATAETAVRPWPPIDWLLKNGVGNTVNPEPFQCIARARFSATLDAGNSSQSPTNHTSFAETTSMSSTKLPEPPMVTGVDRTVHCEPSQCWTMMCVPTKPSGAWITLPPAAHTSLEETACTLWRSAQPPPGYGLGLGVGTMVQAEPFQCIARVWVSDPPLVGTYLLPTAHTSLGAITDSS